MPVPTSTCEVFAQSEAGKAQSFDLPVEVALSSTTNLTRMTSPNVAGIIEGSDPALKGEYIVYTAHLDHIGKGTAVAGDEIYNGAFDNASGIAVLLETARYFAALPRKPRRSMLFLAVTAEEQGLLGSEYFARQPTVPREAIVANVNMDMPLALTDRWLRWPASTRASGSMWATRASGRSGTRVISSAGCSRGRRPPAGRAPAALVRSVALRCVASPVRGSGVGRGVACLQRALASGARRFAKQYPVPPYSAGAVYGRSPAISNATGRENSGPSYTNV